MTQYGAEASSPRSVRDRRRRRLLLFLIGALFCAVVAPAVSGWRLIAAYAALPYAEAIVERTIPLVAGEIAPEASGEGIAVAPDGAIFVADPREGRLLAYPAGTPESGVVLAGPPRGPLLRGSAVALTPDGAIALLEESTGLVHFFTRSGALLRRAPLTDPGARAMAIDSLGNVYVSGSEGRLRKFLPNDQPDLLWGDPATPGVVQFGEAIGLFAQPDALYAALNSTREIAVLDSRGRLKERRKLLGLAGMLSAAPDGSLYMSDFLTARVWILDRSGRTIGRILGAKGDEELFSQPRGLAALRGKRLWVMNDQHLTLYTLRGPRTER